MPAKPRPLFLKFTSERSEEVSLAFDLELPSRRRPKAIVLFMPGYTSVRNGEKAQAYREAARDAGLAWLAFDPRGHGDSSGKIRELTLHRHVEDLGAAHAVAQSVAPTVIGVGSSLGGLTMAVFAASQQNGFSHITAIAPGFGFFERWSRVPKSRWPEGMTAAAIASARTATTARIAPRVRTPMLVWHGMRDEAVDWRQSVRFAQRCPAFVEVRLFNDGDHRLTRWKQRLAVESIAQALAHTSSS